MKNITLTLGTMLLLIFVALLFAGFNLNPETSTDPQLFLWMYMGITVATGATGALLFKDGLKQFKTA